MRLKLLPLFVAALPFALSTGAHAQSQTAYGTVKLEKLPYSGDVLMARAIRSGLIKVKSVTASRVTAPTLKCTPAPCALPNVAPFPPTQPQDETPIASSPTNAKVLLAGSNDYECSSSLQGYYVSTNGGSKWTHSCGTLASGGSGGEGDPIVAFDTNGVAYRGGIDVVGAGVVVVAKSTDNGKTWSTPVIAASDALGSLADKPWMEIDRSASSPHMNNIYVSTTQFAANNDSQIYVSTSADGGATWHNVAASTLGTYPVVNQFSDLAVGNDGTVYLSFMRCTANGSAGDCGGTKATMYISKSTDGGATWSKAGKINTVNLSPDNCGAFYGCLPNTSERVSDIPVISIDNSTGANAGKLYVTEYNWSKTHMVVQVVSSTDGGTTWSKPKAVNKQSQDQFFPWINVDSATGDVGVTWLDRREDSANVNYDAFGAVSTDGGTTYPNLRLSTVSSNPFNDGFGSGFMGDYTGNAWDGTRLFNTWTDTRGGSISQIEVGGILQ